MEVNVGGARCVNAVRKIIACGFRIPVGIGIRRPIVTARLSPLLTAKRRTGIFADIDLINKRDLHFIAYTTATGRAGAGRGACVGWPGLAWCTGTTSSVIVHP